MGGKAFTCWWSVANKGLRLGGEFIGIIFPYSLLTNLKQNSVDWCAKASSLEVAGAPGLWGYKSRNRL